MNFQADRIWAFILLTIIYGHIFALAVAITWDCYMLLTRTVWSQLRNCNAKDTQVTEA